MCGIVGYIGNKVASPIILDGLSRLEYRGYDSAGLAVLERGNLVMYKKKGRLNELKKLLVGKNFTSTVGIGHTRWATHGVPSDENAHPHKDCTGNFAVVHNGIIENYGPLKKRLKAKGHKFLSDTDTEVIVHLVEDNYKGDLEAAVRKAVRALKGTYAIFVLSKKDPGKLVVARLGSPLVIGVGKGENFAASDVPAILNRTRDVIYLGDFEMAVITRDSVKLSGVDGKPILRSVSKILWDNTEAQKSGFRHFMLKEIYEQPRAIRSVLAGRVGSRGGKVIFEKEVMALLNDKFLSKLKHIIIVSCGTAYHAGLVGEYLIEKYAGIQVDVDLSSEFRYRDPEIDEEMLVIIVSQSGETADSLAALRLAKLKGAKILSICNVIGSTIARESDAVIYTQAGPEIAVASTKAYTTQLAVFVLLTIYLSTINRKLPKKKKSIARRLLKELVRIPRLMENLINEVENPKTAKESIREIAKKYAKKYKKDKTKHFLFLGRNVNFPTALEGALKLKEICYISSEGYAAGEMKHGPIALAYRDHPVVCVAPESVIYEKMFSNMQEIKARNADLIVVTTKGDRKIRELADHVFYIPKIAEFLSPILAIVPLQLLAYYISCGLKHDPDKPRNLAKSVTVE